MLNGGDWRNKINCFSSIKEKLVIMQLPQVLIITGTSMGVTAPERKQSDGSSKILFQNQTRGKTIQKSTYNLLNYLSKVKEGIF